MRRALGLALGVALAGCATYRPLPLAQDARLTDRVADVKVDVASMPTAALRQHVFDPSRGLDMTDVAMLAVANNPMLKVARDQRGIAHAQAFAAGLLPDPVLDFSRGYPTAGPANSTAYSAGLSYDLGALLAHGWDVRAARATAKQVDLDLLWQEWQVIAASRQLFVRCVYQARMLDILRDEASRRERFHRQLARAQRRGDVSLAALGLDQSALQAVQSRRDAMARQLLASRQALNALLGLSPQAQLPLLQAAVSPGPGKAEISRDLATLAQRRPDLLALQAGYRSADMRYRRAIWQQFPSIDVGFSKGRDTDAISSRSFQVSLTLPIFNRNRGNVAIAKATRQALHDEYTLRLAQAKSDIARLLNDRAILQRQRAELATSVAVQTQVAAKLESTAIPGDLSQAQRLALQLRRDDQRLDLLGIEQAMLEQQAALAALLADAQ
ncbi:MAG: TolC family protein [Xanthomonadaceae bacterium]|jgi:outer membrane protein TolC|nr:TolC family protein [Xanthomonadaceae bacterium]